MATQPIAAPDASQNPPAGYTPIMENGQNVGLSTKDWGDIVSERPAQAVVAFPDGSNVQFPDAATAQQHAASVWQQLKSAVRPSAEFLVNEVKGAGQMIMGLPSAIADSVTVQPTAEEQKNLGVSANPSLAEKAALALYRNLGEPIQNAAQWYGTLVKHHQNIIDAIPQDVLAQGIGAGAGAAVLGKVLGPEEAGRVAQVGKQLAVREHGEAGLPGTVGEPFTQERPAATTSAPVESTAKPTDENVTGRNARRAEPVQTVIPGTGVEEVNPEVDNRPDVPTFYSKVAKLVDEKVKGKSGNGDQILATLRNSGAKEDEIKWMGLDDYLKDKPKVSKADLQQFINDNQIQLGEVNRTAAAEGRGAMQAEQNQLHDYITAVQGRNADSSLGKALTQWLADEGPESTSKLLSHPDMTLNWRHKLPGGTNSKNS